MPDDLYDHDILAWSEAQADRLRRVAAGELVNDVDWAHVIEEVEDVGKSELKSARSLFRNAVLHALKVAAWPESQTVQHWRNEAMTFLADARDRYEPGMARALDTPRIYRDALRTVRRLDMGVPPATLPEDVVLTPAEFADDEFGIEQLLARIRAALPPG